MTTNEIVTTIGRRETYIQQTGPREVTIWQSMGKFHRIQVTNSGAFCPSDTAHPHAWAPFPRWIGALLSKHGATIREWCGFTNEQRQGMGEVQP